MLTWKFLLNISEPGLHKKYAYKKKCNTVVQHRIALNNEKNNSILANIVTGLS